MAKAQLGKTYAQIVNGRCHWIFTQVQLPEYNDNHIQVVDVTGNVPSVGDDWNGSSFVPHVKTARELAEEVKAAENAAMNAEKASAKALPRVQAFIAKSRAEVKADVQGAGNLNQLKDIVEDLAIILHVLAKREFK